jgi:hypothetical protein
MLKIIATIIASIIFTFSMINFQESNGELLNEVNRVAECNKLASSVETLNCMNNKSN